MREFNITSKYDASTRVTTVYIDVYKRLPSIGVRYLDNTYTGKARWNKKYDEFNPAEGFRVAYERALAQIPKENIIEKCGGLKDGDWVLIQSKNGNDAKWGIVFHDGIFYVIGNDNWDRISDFPDGESRSSKITTIVRPIGHFPITVFEIDRGIYKKNFMKERCKIYTAD